MGGGDTLHVITKCRYWYSVCVVKSQCILLSWCVMTFLDYLFFMYSKARCIPLTCILYTFNLTTHSNYEPSANAPIMSCYWKWTFWGSENGNGGVYWVDRVRAFFLGGGGNFNFVLLITQLWFVAVVVINRLQIHITTVVILCHCEVNEVNSRNRPFRKWRCIHYCW